MIGGGGAVCWVFSARRATNSSFLSGGRRLEVDEGKIRRPVFVVGSAVPANLTLDGLACKVGVAAFNVIVRERFTSYSSTVQCYQRSIVPSLKSGGQRKCLPSLSFLIVVVVVRGVWYVAVVRSSTLLPHTNQHS